MPYVQRDSNQQICAISRSAQPGFDEHVADDDPQLRGFLVAVAGDSPLARTDLEFVRVLEDLLEVLISKNVLLFTELPEPAQAKILQRQALRGRDNALDLLDNEPRI
ncbi:tryptophan synthase subunit beta like protein [bacterium]|nr:hypothetical protein [Congregibacter sp.]MDA8962473.1 hypothetical protein [Congregibacter sp.]MDB4476410.1 tryptophan synthase subunit beta like protein [bacterium]